MNVGRTVGIVAVLILVAVAFTQGNKPEVETKAPPTPAMLALAKQCDDVIAKAEKAGVVMARPDVYRIEVDELTWAMLPAETKRGLLKAVRCMVLGGDMTQSGTGSAYGYHSGKRLARATSVGVEFD